MTIWQVRIGRESEREQIALDKKLVFIGWEDLPDLTKIKTIEDLAVLSHKVYSQEKPRTIANWVRQIWTFRERIQSDDLVIIPFKSRSTFAVGKISGAYQYHSDLPLNIHHTRAVEWIKKDLPRSAFDDDLLRSLGSILSVCQIQRNQAEERIQAIVDNP